MNLPSPAKSVVRYQPSLYGTGLARVITQRVAQELQSGDAVNIVRYFCQRTTHSLEQGRHGDVTWLLNRRDWWSSTAGISVGLPLMQKHFASPQQFTYLRAVV